MVAVPAAVVTVIKEDPLPVMVVGLNPTVAPAGRPLTENPTVPANPFTAPIVTVYPVLPPEAADCVAGAAPTVKSGGPTTVSVALVE